MRGIWISDEEAVEIIDHGIGGNWEEPTEDNGGVTGAIFRSGTQLFLLRYIEVNPGVHIFVNDALDYDEETGEVFCQEMESYQGCETHDHQYRPRKS
jgi:hypothetical protein